MIDAKLEEKLEPITKRLNSVEKNIAKKDDLAHMATKTDIHGITEDMAGFFHKAWEKMDETNERVWQPLKTISTCHTPKRISFSP